MTDEVAEPVVFDDRGLAIVSEQLDLYGPSDVWEALRQLGASIRGDEEQWRAAFFGLPEKQGSYIRVQVHSHGTEDDKVHWTLLLRPSPEKEPPSFISESSQKVGGYPGCLVRLAALLPNEVTANMEVDEVNIIYYLDPKIWKPVLADGPELTTLDLGGGRTLVQDVQTWEASGFSPAVSRISLMAVDDSVAVSVYGVPALKFSPGIMQLAEQEVWNEVRGCLVKRP